MEISPNATFHRNYERHLQHLRLKGLQPKTIDAYARAIRHIGERFDHQIDNLSVQQLTDYFAELTTTYSWSVVKHEFYGLQFYYAHVLCKPWVAPGLIKPPRTQRLPDVLTVTEMRRLIASTEVLSYRVFFFTLYSMGLRVGEGLRLQVGDIDGERGRVHIRNAKGNKDRFVPLPKATYMLLRDFWRGHRNPVLLFPSRRGGVNASAKATTTLNYAGVSAALHKVVAAAGLKKRSLCIPLDIRMQPI